MTIDHLPTDPDAPAQLPAVVEHGLRWLCQECFSASVAKGWGAEPDGSALDPDVCVVRAIALMHSELSEALEEWRKPDAPLDAIWYGPGAKPEGFVVELADLAHRLFALCGRFRLDLAKALALKMAYNRTRPHRHGGKRC